MRVLNILIFTIIYVCIVYEAPGDTIGFYGNTYLESSRAVSVIEEEVLVGSNYIMIALILFSATISTEYYKLPLRICNINSKYIPKHRVQNPRSSILGSVG